MNYEKELKKMGIEVLDKVEDKNIMRISRKVAHALAETFPKCDFRYMDIYRILINTPMTYAKFPKGYSKANYFYKNSTLYFSKEFDFHACKKYAFHECIHRIQEKRDKNGRIIKFGICQVNALKLKGAALNEGAIQYVVYKALNFEIKPINVYGIMLYSSTEYYPLLTCIVNQLVLLIGEDVLIDSTIRANEEFKYAIIDNLGKKSYRYIEKRCNNILKMKNKLSKLQKDVGNNICEIENISYKIKKAFYETQKTIFESYFKKTLKKCENEKEIHQLIEKMRDYEKIIGSDSEYNDFELFKEKFKKKLKTKMK